MMKTNKRSGLIILVAFVLLIITLIPSVVYAIKDENDYFSIEPPYGFEKTTKENYTDNGFMSEYKNSNMTIRIEVQKMTKGEPLKEYINNKDEITRTDLYSGKYVDKYTTVGPSDYDIFSATVKSSRSYVKYYFIATDNYYFTIICRTNGKKQFINNEKKFDTAIRQIEIFDTVSDPEKEQRTVKIAYIVVFAVLFIIIISFISFIKKLLKEQEKAKVYASHLNQEESEDNTEEKKYNNYEKTQQEQAQKEKPKYTYNPGYNYNFEVGKDNKGSYYSQKDLNKYIKNDENNENQ